MFGSTFPNGCFNNLNPFNGLFKVSEEDKHQPERDGVELESGAKILHLTF